MSQFALEPMNDRLIVKPDGEEGELRESGLFIPPNEDERTQVGTVVAVGPGAFSEDGSRRLNIGFEVGDRIFFKQYGPQKIDVGDTRYVTMEARDVIARFRGSV